LAGCDKIGAAGQHAAEFWQYSISRPYCQFLGPETDIFCQFLDPETEPLCQFLGPENFKMSQILFKWIFLGSIERIHIPEHVQIVFSFSIGLISCKNNWDQFLGPKTDP
jgi:hypothetical protein